LKMPAFEWVHVQLHQQKGMISLSPPTICNSADTLFSLFPVHLLERWVSSLELLEKCLGFGLSLVHVLVLQQRWHFHLLGLLGNLLSFLNKRLILLCERRLLSVCPASHREYQRHQNALRTGDMRGQ
ncbi:hypothetical protein, partial [Klebsiella pneumoniae]|uniref:hypothetical protein n=1 Tax=Klebsiella pneumoniae TaxID=573 RepID=UPI001C6ED91F